MSPAKFVEKLRIEMARKLLEETDLTLDAIAEKCGLGGMISMRRTFLRHLMVSPASYRRAFRSALRNNPATASHFQLPPVFENDVN
jgi:transcriptional regulator GlxA family with amidase domain